MTNPFSAATDLPDSLAKAATRGAMGHCPRCGEGQLFRAFLKPLDRCPACHIDWTPQCADDFPAYISIFITGHVVTPLLLYMVLATDMGMLTTTLIALAVSMVMMLAVLQPAKGAVIAMQWWNGMHGFVRERRPMHNV